MMQTFGENVKSALHYAEINPTFYSIFLARHMQTTYYEATYRYTDLVQACDKAIDHIKSDRLQYSDNRIGQFRVKKVSATICLGRYEECDNEVTLCYECFSESSLNRLPVLFYHVVLKLHQVEYTTAMQLYLENFPKLENNTNVSPYEKERWYFLAAFIAVALKYLKQKGRILSQPEQDFISSLELQKLDEKCPRLMANHRGWKATYWSITFMHYMIERRSEDFFTTRTLALREYIKKNIRTQASERVLSFFFFLRTLSQFPEDHKVVSALKKVKATLKESRGMEGDSDLLQELIPLEVQVEMVMLFYIRRHRFNFQ